MIYYADNNGNYLGMSNCNMRPDGARHTTEVKPEHGGQVYDPKADDWITPPDVKAAGKPSKGPGCQGITKAYTSCKHKATHGLFCRQHIWQA